MCIQHCNVGLLKRRQMEVCVYVLQAKEWLPTWARFCQEVIDGSENGMNCKSWTPRSKQDINSHSATLAYVAVIHWCAKGDLHSERVLNGVTAPVRMQQMRNGIHPVTEGGQNGFITASMTVESPLVPLHSGSYLGGC